MTHKVKVRHALTVFSVLAWSTGIMLSGCSSGGDDEGTTPPDASPTPTGATPTLEPTPTQKPDVPTPTPEVTPTPRAEFTGEIQFADLADNDTLSLALDTVSAEIEFEVKNFTLKDPGECKPADAPCGHVHLNIDGEAGNHDDQPYNNAGSSSPIAALFEYLPDPTGPHTVSLELVYDDHSPTGERSSVDVNVEYAEPTITVVSPSEGQNITLPTNKQVAVTVAVTDFEFAAPGECGDKPNCGHIHLKIDGDHGNSSEAPYNTAGVSENLIADFSLLEANGYDSAGDHTITVELHRDDHSAYEGAGAVHAVNVKIASAGDPTLAIVSPANGSTVKLGNDGYKSVPVTLSLQNFTLKAPGTCGSQVSCGHIHLHLDDTDGDNPEAPYNTAGASLNIDALFYWLEYNEHSSTGSHKISISLHKDDHSVVVVNGTSVEAATSIVTTPNDNPTISISSPQTDDMVSVGADSKGTVTLNYKLTNFTVKSSGCGTTPNCGHIRANIDGNDGNAPSKTFNSEGSSATSIDTYFAYLDDNGFNMLDEHRVTVTLVKDDGSPIQFSNSDGTKTAIQDFVTFTTVAP